MVQIGSKDNVDVYDYIKTWMIAVEALIGFLNLRKFFIVIQTPNWDRLY